MAMKINTRGNREFELVFESETKLLSLDKKFVAAEVHIPNGDVLFLRTNQPLSPQDTRLVDIWLGSQPKMVRDVSPTMFDKIVSTEHNKT
jgi:hypothetical protein